VGETAIHLLVGAGKGGVGKSTVSLNLALALAARGRRVALLDADLTGPNIPIMVGLTRYEPRGQWQVAARRPRKLEPVERYGIPIFSSGFLFGEDQNLHAIDMSDLMLRQLLTHVEFGDVELVIVDVPPGSGRIHDSIVKLTTRPHALIVVTPQRVAHLDARKAIDMYRRLRVPVIGGVENMAELRCPNCASPVSLWPEVAADRAIWTLEVPNLGRIPFEPATAADGDAGRPAVATRPDGATAIAFAGVASQVERALFD
jgi:ATP-binding protein involved in chromosome partitioning